MNIESLCRTAINRIKSEFGLPDKGLIAGGSIGNIIWELVSGNKAVINDVDVFLFTDELDDSYDEKSIFDYKESKLKFYEDYGGITAQVTSSRLYSIIKTDTDGIFNNIKYTSENNDPFLVIKSFDINSTRVGYSIENDKFYYTKDFEEFLKTGELKISNLTTPAHTAVRLAKKSKELSIPIDELEWEILQYTLSRRFTDILKIRFKERYKKIYNDNIDMLFDKFSLIRDEDTEKWVESQFGEICELHTLVPKTESTLISDDLNNIITSYDYLFYIRNIKNNDKFKKIWKELYCFFNNNDYIDIEEINYKDIDILSRLVKYSPSSIDNLKDLKLSEQINIVNLLLDKFKDDPIIAISILEKVKMYKDFTIDDQTALILELSVRKLNIDDRRNKVNKILYNIDGEHSYLPF